MYRYIDYNGNLETYNKNVNKSSAVLKKKELNCKHFTSTEILPLADQLFHKGWEQVDKGNVFQDIRVPLSEKTQ